MAWMHIKDVLAELVAPSRCAGCGRSGTVLCDWCVEDIQRYRTKHACPRCGAPYGELVCTECAEKEFAFDRVVCLGELDGSLSRAVVIYKDAFEYRLGEVLGDLLAQQCMFQFALDGVAPDLVSWIPPTDRALRRRGYDHAGVLADCVARQLGVPCRQHLTRRPVRDLRLLSREERLQETRDSFGYANGTPDVCGLHVLVVDDVLTTGATLNAASQMFLDAGCTLVTGAIIARAW